MDFKKFKERNARFITTRIVFRGLIILLGFFPALVNGQIQERDHQQSLPTIVPTITGPDTVCGGIGSYIYFTEPGMTNYNWTVSAGGTMISPNGTNSIT